MPYARLVKGASYDVNGINFLAGRAPVEVDADLADYLSKNDQFEVTAELAEGKAPEGDKDDERETLIALAKELELKFAKNISTDKLRELVEKAELGEE